MTPLTRSMILSSSDLERELVEVPEWGGSVYVRALTGSERDQFESESVLYRPKGKSEPDMTALHQTRARLCARAMCDESGNRLFTDEDIAALAAKSSAPLDRIYAVAARLSRITAEDMEELEKNSEKARAAASSSRSP